MTLSVEEGAREGGIRGKVPETVAYCLLCDTMCEGKGEERVSRGRGIRGKVGSLRVP